MTDIDIKVFLKYGSNDTKFTWYNLQIFRLSVIQRITGINIGLRVHNPYFLDYKC